MTATKYNSKKVELDGYTFDSQIEARYYQRLKWLQEHKEILFFRLQPRYLLQDSFKKNGKTYRKIEYIADFEIHHLDGSIEVVDVKGMETEAFKIKKKLFEFRYDHSLKVVTLDETYGWIELEKLQKLKKKSKKVKPGAKKKANTLGYPNKIRKRVDRSHIRTTSKKTNSLQD